MITILLVVVAGKKFTWGRKVTSHSVDGVISMIKIFTMYFMKSKSLVFVNTSCYIESSSGTLSGGKSESRLGQLLQASELFGEQL